MYRYIISCVILSLTVILSLGRILEFVLNETALKLPSPDCDIKQRKVSQKPVSYLGICQTTLIKTFCR